MNTLTDLFLHMDRIDFATNDDTKLTAQQAMLMGISAVLIVLAEKLGLQTDAITNEISLDKLLPMLEIIKLKSDSTFIDDIQYRVL